MIHILDDRQFPVLDTLGIPYVDVQMRPGISRTLLFTMDKARGLFDLCVELNLINADEIPPAMEVLREKGLLQTGQDVRERITAYEQEEQDWNFGFQLCTECAAPWPHGYLHWSNGKKLLQLPIHSLLDLVNVTPRVSQEHLIALLKQGVDQGLAADYFDTDDRFETLRKECLDQHRVG